MKTVEELKSILNEYFPKWQLHAINKEGTVNEVNIAYRALRLLVKVRPDTCRAIIIEVSRGSSNSVYRSEIFEDITDLLEDIYSFLLNNFPGSI